MSAKEILIQSCWRYNTFAVVKRHKNHLSLSFQFTILLSTVNRNYFVSAELGNYFN